MKKRVQIAFDIDPTVRTRIKIAAAKRNISMNLWLMRVIFITLRKEEDGERSPPSTQSSR